jgi:thiol-disulfide isomerase/thioredoxin
MMKNKNYIKYCLLYCIILCSSIVYSSDKTAPSFALFSTDGNLVKLNSEITKNDILLVFFAGYCIPCKNEIPDLVKLHKKYSDRFNIIYVNIDKEGKPAAEKVLGELGITDYTCLLDIYQKTIKKYSPSLAIPAFFLIDKSGKIRYESIGYKSENINSFENYIIKNK